MYAQPLNEKPSCQITMVWVRIDTLGPFRCLAEWGVAAGEGDWGSSQTQAPGLLEVGPLVLGPLGIGPQVLGPLGVEPPALGLLLWVL